MFMGIERNGYEYIYKVFCVSTHELRFHLSGKTDPIMKGNAFPMMFSIRLDDDCRQNQDVISSLNVKFS